MTREEIRLAFRQALEEEFAALPQQPAIHASPKFEQRMERMLGLGSRHISKTKKIAILLLAAILLILGGCTVYQVVSSATINYTGEYTYGERTEHRYLVWNSKGGHGAGYVPYYLFPEPEGFEHLCVNREQVGHRFDQWYNPDTGDVLNLTQMKHYNALRFEPPLELTLTQINGIPVYYGCGEEASYAFWLYQDSAIQLVYWGSVSKEQLLSWIGQMDYADHAGEFTAQQLGEYDCYIPFNYITDYLPPETIRFIHMLRSETYDEMENSATGRDETADYNFKEPPAGFTQTSAENEYSSEMDGGRKGMRVFGAAYTYENLQGDRLVLEQTILMPLPDRSGTFMEGIPGAHPGEDIHVLDLEGVYLNEGKYSQIIWRYGGRQMILTYYGEISPKELIAIAETVNYSDAEPSTP